MKIKDLINLVSFQMFYETCKIKLNNTLIMYNNEWGYCTVSDGPFYNETNMYKYGEGRDWLHISYLPSRHGHVLDLNTLDDIETELLWPDIGYYWWENTSYILSYPTTHIYKAGLSPAQLSLTKLHLSGDRASSETFTMFLNYIKKCGIIYPTLDEATGLLLTTSNMQIPISSSALVEAHPYSEDAVVSYGSIPVGVVKRGALSLTPSNKPLEEYFNHVGVPLV